MASDSSTQYKAPTDMNTRGDSYGALLDFVIAVKVILYIAGFAGNLFVIFVITYLKEYKKTAHWYLLQLSMADFLFLNTIPFKVTEAIRGAWVYSVSACKAVQAILFFNYYASILFLTVMAIDRYTAVCHPLSPRVRLFRTPAFCYWASAAIWIISLALSIPLILYSNVRGMDPDCTCTFDFPKDLEAWCLQNNIANESCKEDAISQQNIGCYPMPDIVGSDLQAINYTNIFDSFGDEADYSTNQSDDGEISGIDQACAAYDSFRPGMIRFFHLNFALMFVFPLLVIAVCYGFIVYRVTKRKEIHADKFSSVRGQHRKVVKESKRVTMVCGLLVVFFTACWLPFHSWHLVKTIGMPLADGDLCNQIAIALPVLAYVNSAMNPFIYNFFGKNFRARIRQIRLRRFGRNGRHVTGFAPSNSSATTSLGTRHRSARI